MSPGERNALYARAADSDTRQIALGEPLTPTPDPPVSPVSPISRLSAQAPLSGKARPRSPRATISAIAGARWYIAQDSLDHADRFLDRLQERFSALADFPKMGVCRDDIQAGLRSQPVGNDLIFYFPLVDGIETGGRPVFIPSSLLQPLFQTTTAPLHRPKSSGGSLVSRFPRKEDIHRKQDVGDSDARESGDPRMENSLIGAGSCSKGLEIGGDVEVVVGVAVGVNN